MEQRVLGFDPGLNFGFVSVNPEYIQAWRPSALDGSPPPAPGSMKTGVRVISGRGAAYEHALSEVWMWLEGWSTQYKIIGVASEDLQGNFKSQRAMLAQVGMHSAVATWCGVNGIPLARYRPQSIKKFATGNGHAEKERVFAAAVARGWPVKKFDDADAGWALDMLLSEHYQRRHGAAPRNLGDDNARRRKPRPASGAPTGQKRLAL